jgi:hypothetical protein
MYAVRGPYSKAVGQCSKTGGFALVAPDDVVCHRRGCRTGNFGAVRPIGGTIHGFLKFWKPNGVGRFAESLKAIGIGYLVNLNYNINWWRGRASV